MIKVEDLKGDSLEQVLLKPFGELKKEPMTEEETRLFLSFEIMNQENSNLMYAELINRKDTWVLKAMDQRVHLALTILIEKKVAMFIFMFLNGNIGRCMVYLLYLQYWAKKNNKKEVTWSDFCMRIFPDGFPNEQGFRKLWNAQKVMFKTGHSSNMIDINAAQKSIHY